MSDEQYIGYWVLEEDEPLYVVYNDQQCSVIESLPEVVSRCTVILPSLAVSNQLITVSLKQLKSIRRAFPYILEDELLDSVDTMHHVYTLQEKEGDEATLQSISISSSLMDTIVNFFNQRDIQLEGIFVDADLCERPDFGQVNVLSAPMGNVARLADGAFVSAELLADSDLNGLLRHELLQEKECKLTYLAKRLQTEHKAQNLMSGSYLPSANNQHWKVSARFFGFLISFALILQFVYWQAGAYVFESRAKAQSELAENEYRRIFPEDTRVINVRKQASGHLKRAVSSGGKVVLLDLIYELSKVSEEGGFKLVLQSIRYDQMSKETVLMLQLDSIARAESLIQALSARGIATSLGQVRREGDGVIARLKVEA